MASRHQTKAPKGGNQTTSGDAADPPITTLMFRNLPRKYTALALTHELEGLLAPEKWDFVYLPWDTTTPSNMGYAFMNFVDAESAALVLKLLDGKPWRLVHSYRAIKIVQAHVQGFQQNLIHCAHKVAPDTDPAHAPLVYHNGKQIDFRSAVRLYGRTKSAAAQQQKQQLQAKKQKYKEEQELRKQQKLEQSRTKSNGGAGGAGLQSGSNNSIGLGAAEGKTGRQQHPYKNMDIEEQVLNSSPTRGSSTAVSSNNCSIVNGSLINSNSTALPQHHQQQQQQQPQPQPQSSSTMGLQHKLQQQLQQLLQQQQQQRQQQVQQVQQTPVKQEQQWLQSLQQPNMYSNVSSNHGFHHQLEQQSHFEPSTTPTFQPPFIMSEITQDLTLMEEPTLFPPGLPQQQQQHQQVFLQPSSTNLEGSTATGVKFSQDVRSLRSESKQQNQGRWFDLDRGIWQDADPRPTDSQSCASGTTASGGRLATAASDTDGQRMAWERTTNQLLELLASSLGVANQQASPPVSNP